MYELYYLIGVAVLLLATAILKLWALKMVFDTNERIRNIEKRLMP